MSEMKKWKYMLETFGSVIAETEEEAIATAQRKLVEQLQESEMVTVWEVDTC